MSRLKPPPKMQSDAGNGQQSEENIISPQIAGTRRQDLLVLADNLGIEQRPLILPTARNVSDDFSDDDDDDDFIAMERVDDAAQRQEILVVDRAEKRRLDAEMKELMREHLQIIREHNDAMHKLHLYSVVCNFTKRMAFCVKYASHLGNRFLPKPNRDYSVVQYLNALTTKKWMKLQDFKRFADVKPEDISNFYSLQRMRFVAAGFCETELDAAVSTVINLTSVGFVTRLVYAFKAIPKGETNVCITEEMVNLFTKNGNRFPEEFCVKGRRTEAAEKKLKIGVYDKRKGKGKAGSSKSKVPDETDSVMDVAESALSEDDEFENEDEIDAVQKKKPKLDKKAGIKKSKVTGKTAVKKVVAEPMDTSEAATSLKLPMVKSYCFVEVWDEKEFMWIDFDPLDGIINDSEKITKKLDKQVDYIFGFDSDGGFRDVSIKYIKNFVLPERRQSRIEESYVKKLMLIKPILASLERNLCEDELITAKIYSMDLPKSKGAYKNHFFYALSDQLKVKEALYPQNPVPVAEHNIFDVYSRKNVGILDIDLRWKRKGFQVKEGETPYKLTPGRSRGKKQAPDQKLFGGWQLERYPAPEIEEDGSIPVNANGNVYLYKSWMTPKECFHLKVNGHGEEIAKLAEVEYAQAVVGWTFKKAKYFPVMYGVVVKMEDLPVIMKAKQKYFKQGLNKKYQRRIRRTIFPYLNKDKARQAFIKQFYRCTGSVAKKNLKFFHFDFGIPDEQTFSSCVDKRSIIDDEKKRAEYLTECASRLEKQYNEENSKKAALVPLSKTKIQPTAKNGPKKLATSKQQSPIMAAKEVNVNPNRRITRSSTRASIAVVAPVSTRKPLVATQRNNTRKVVSESDSDE